MTKRLNLNINYIIHAYTIDKKSLETIAKELNCSYVTIIERLKELDIKRRTISESRMGLMKWKENPSFKKLDDKYIINEYIINNRSAKSIAKELKCDPKTITRHLREYDIKIRNSSEARIGLERNSRFENLDINYIKKLYISDEKTAKQIAQELNCSFSTIFKYLRMKNIKIRSRSESKRGRKNPMFGKSGEKNPNWKNGISFQPYCYKFNHAFKEEIRNLFNRKCYLCGKTEEENQKHLSVHHIDYHKNSICNGKKWAFLPLCQKCHTKTNGKRYYYFNLLINYWSLNPEINFSEVN